MLLVGGDGFGVVIGRLLMEEVADEEFAGAALGVRIKRGRLMP